MPTLTAAQRNRRAVAMRLRDDAAAYATELAQCVAVAVAQLRAIALIADAVHVEFDETGSVPYPEWGALAMIADRQARTLERVDETYGLRYLRPKGGPRESGSDPSQRAATSQVRRPAPGRRERGRA